MLDVEGGFQRREVVGRKVKWFAGGFQGRKPGSRRIMTSMELAGSMRPFCRCVLSKSRDDAAPRCPLFLTQFGRHSRLVLDLLVRLLMYFLPLLINEQTEVVSMEGLSNDVRPPQVPQSPLHQVEPSLCLRLAPIHVKVHDGVVEAPCGTDTISEHPMPSFHSRQNVRPRRHNGELYLSDSDPGATVKTTGPKPSYSGTMHASV